MDKINICVCTYKRKQLLKNCLLSLYAMKIPDNCDVTISIIDNHDAQSAQAIVDELSIAGTLPTHYFSEHNRGIAFARNRAILETKQLGAKFLVFIDDDEWVEKEWLVHLYGHCVKKGGDIIVSGDVIPEIPVDIPSDIKPFICKKNTYSTGKKLSSCATNNVIFPINIPTDLNLEFDFSNPFSGGEDTIFFSTAVRRGIIIEKCAEAIVHEHIPHSRGTLKWLVKRKFWVGTINSWRKRQDGSLLISVLISSIMQVLWHGVLTLILTVIRAKIKRNRALFKVSRATGQIFGLFGYRHDSY